METNIFDRFFKRTLWSEKTTAPTYDELISMENDFMEALLVMKTSGDYQVYRYHFSQKGKQVISRIGFYLRTLDANPENADIKRLRDSYTRLREALKSLDRKLYESELRTDIQKGKRMRTHRRLKQDASNQQQLTSISPPFFEHIKITKDKLEALHQVLINKGWLHEQTSVSDFVYYFSGIGSIPSNKIIWKASKTLLSIFISCIENDNPEWVIAEQVFVDTTAKSLKSLLSIVANKHPDSYSSKNKEIKSIINSL